MSKNDAVYERVRNMRLCIIMEIWIIGYISRNRDNWGIWIPRILDIPMIIRDMQ